jgi:nucleotide-binding universal stress UspA family protein
MDRYPLVLIGTDQSPDAAAAVRIGARIAARTGVPLKVLAVGEAEKDSGQEETWRTVVLAEAEAIATELGVTEISLELPDGTAQEVMVEQANAEPDALVVVGSAASTSNRLAHHSRADLLFAKDPVPETWNFVAVATDGSSSSYQAVRRGLRAAAALGATGRLITVAKTEEAGAEVLDAAWETLDLDSIDVEIEREVLIESQPASAIIAAGWKYELVAIGNRGMSGPERLLGSVANKVSHGLKTNLLLVNTTRE